MALPKLNTPKYTMTIPSTGLSVEYRPYLVREEKLLMIAMESEDENQMLGAVKDIIRECTFNQVNIDNLSTFDIEYMFIKLRAKSVGESSEIGIKCQSCEHLNKHKINLDDEVKVSKGQDKKIQLTEDTGVIMKYVSMTDYMDVVNSERSKIEKLFDLMAKGIDSVYSGDEVFDASEQTHDELVDFLESLNSEQYIKIRSFIENSPQACADVHFACEKCGSENEIELKGLKNFFR